MNQPLPIDLRVALAEQIADFLQVLGTLQRQIAPSRPELAGDIAHLAADAHRLLADLVIP